MKHLASRLSALAVAFALMMSLVGTSFAAPAKGGTTPTDKNTEKTDSFVPPEKSDMSKKYRVLITTDMEVDDANGIMLTLLFSNEVDIAGLVWTAGMWHFNGDGGKTTLGEVIQEVNTKYDAKLTYKTGNGVPNADRLFEFRPAEPNRIMRLIDVNYRTDYEWLSQNDPDYPDPDYLLSLYKEGNIQFEGDVREATEGSEWIKQCILDDDPRTLYITHWGGSNTTCKALLDIYDEYHGTDKWDAILKKIVNKVVFESTGEDNCWDGFEINKKFPGLKIGGTPVGFSNFGSYGVPTNADPEVLPYYKGAYLTDAFKLNHGMLTGEIHLVGDGQVIYGEPYVAQYGLKTYVHWAELKPYYSNSSYLSFVPRWDMERYDWLCNQWTNFYVDFGQRSDAGILPLTDNQRLIILFEELAARADWSCMPAVECNHAPVVSAASDVDFTVKAGDTVKVAGTAIDPDGDKLVITWDAGGKDYKGTQSLTVTGDNETAQFKVPTDAVAGDQFAVTMLVKDDAVRPMTRMVQFIITVKG